MKSYFIEAMSKGQNLKPVLQRRKDEFQQSGDILEWGT